MSSPSGASASLCLLETFPVEILEKIYLCSENPSFAFVTKQISQCLSSEFIQLQFCVSLFSVGRVAWNPGYKGNKLGRTHALVLRQPWFSKGFARKVQSEMVRLGKVRQGAFDRPIPQPYYLFRRFDLSWPWTDRIESESDQIPIDLLLGKPWDLAKVKLIRGLLNWGATIPKNPKNIAPAAMMYAIEGHQYLGVELLHNCGRVRFKHRHFQAAILRSCERRIVEMIVDSNNNRPKPFIDPFDRRIYRWAMELEWDGDPMGRQILNDVLWKGNERELPVATKRLQV